MATPAERLVVSQALLGTRIRLAPGHGVHILLDKIDETDVLHGPSPACARPRTPDSRSVAAEIDSSARQEPIGRVGVSKAEAGSKEVPRMKTAAQKPVDIEGV